MQKSSSSPGAAPPEVVEYYSKNWEKIANCYDLGPSGLPIDPAWYRRRLYQQFLDENRPGSIFDAGCGGGWTVLDALTRNIDAYGVEPVSELHAFAQSLISAKGHDPQRITRNDLSVIREHKPSSWDCAALLSVLPHISAEQWDPAHENIHRILRPGGHLVAAYRNNLFDMYTFNSLTVDFFEEHLWDTAATGNGNARINAENLKDLIVNPTIPGRNFTAADDKSFGKLQRPKSNPLTIKNYLSKFGFQVNRIRFYHFHCVPPLLKSKLPDFEKINYQMEMTMSDDWRGHFMAAMFLVEAQKI